MKKNSLKLTQLSNTELSKKEMNGVKGGNVCGCGCCGSSGNVDNGVANHAGNKNSVGCEKLTYFVDEVKIANK